MGEWYTVALGKKEFNGLKYYWVTNSFLHMMHMRCYKMVKNEVMTLNKQIKFSFCFQKYDYNLLVNFRTFNLKYICVIYEEHLKCACCLKAKFCIYSEDTALLQNHALGLDTLDSLDT